jgi:hypothetical protein
LLFVAWPAGEVDGAFQGSVLELLGSNFVEPDDVARQFPFANASPVLSEQLLAAGLFRRREGVEGHRKRRTSMLTGMGVECIPPGLLSA